MAPSCAARSAASLLRVRWLVRLPILFYRARLGFLFGPRLLMLEHTGRKTGVTRYVVLEVIDHPNPMSYVVVSGFGKRANWLRNVTANPDVRVWIKGRPPIRAQARRLDDAGSTAALNAYATTHPRAWATLRPVLESTLGTAVTAAGTAPTMVAFDVGDARGR